MAVHTGWTRDHDDGYTWRMDTEGHRRLKQFLGRAELNGAQLAKLAGLRPMQVYHLTRGRRRPSLDVACRLEAATHGAVPCAAWIVRN